MTAARQLTSFFLRKYDFFKRSYQKLEKVGPFECDELEKHCRVSAKCYPTKLPALYTIAKEKIDKKMKIGCEMLRRCKKLKLNKRIRRSHTGGVATPPGFAKPVYVNCNIVQIIM